MNKLLLSVLALGAVACQQQAPATRAAVMEHTVSADTAPVKPRPVSVDSSVQSTSLDLALLQKYNLAPLLQSFNSRPNEPVLPMHSFFGSNFYHIELAFTSVRQDPQHPGHYAVRGKDRYKGTITPLTGMVSFDSVQTDTVHAIDYHGRRVVATSYSFLGSYELREYSSHPGAGIFRGRVVVQASPGNEGQLYTESVNDSLSHGGIILFEGSWLNRANGIQKPASWVADIYHYRGPQIASDFFIGEREPTINPKYAKLGWGSYWENDEWWADSPKPKLNL